MKIKNITFIGLGVMGYPMAGHLSKNNYNVTVYNRTNSKAKKWIDEYHGKIVLSPSEGAANADLVITCVGNDKDLREVLEGPNGVLKSIKSETIIIDHTTASANIAKYFYNICKSKNIDFLDAPVSGGQAGAENGKLSIMIGGDENIFNSTKNVLKSYGKNIQLIGNSGSGQLCKMVNQICIAGLVQGLSEGLSFGLKSKLDMNKVLNVISGGAAQSWQLDNRANTMIKNKFDFGFAVDWMRKDLGMCLDEARRNGSLLPVTALINEFYGNIQNIGGGRWDTSSLIRLLRS